MSLKVRLTLFYSAIAAGLLLLLSAAIYGLVTITLIGQLDEELEEAWTIVQQVTRVNSLGELETIAEVPLSRNIFVQVWDRRGELLATSFSVNQLNEPLDAAHINTDEPIFSESRVSGVQLRVLSVPLIMVGERQFGTLQIGTDMGFVVRAQADLLQLIGISVLIGIAFAALLTWISTQSALASLENARNAAQLIMQTNDLSRRIPQPERGGDEVDQLVTAFNQNLSRIERLLETQRRFLADVGHELRTPLTVIKGNVGLMLRMRAYDEESLEGISEEVDRLTRLVGDLILLAQAEAGKLPMGWEPVELDSLVPDIYRQMAVLAEPRDIDLVLDGIEPAIVCGDVDRLKQVLVNLVSNSIKYTQPGGAVSLSLKVRESLAEIAVSDNGPGIPEADLPYIFERFYRAEKSRSRSKDGKGFGLGLSIAYYIVIGHEGDIEVESKVGVGTTFRVRLPLRTGECLENRRLGE